MKVKPDCPFAKYISGMILECTKTEDPCAHVYFKKCKGWWVNSPNAKICPLRKETR